MTRGTFIGKVSLNSMESKFPYYADGKTKNGDKYHRFNMAVTDDNNNRVMLELFGMKQDTIKTMDTENNSIEVSWKDRKDDDVVESVAFYRKNRFSFVPDETVEFISTYDAVEYLNDNADTLKDAKVGVTCNVNKNIYKGKITDRFVIQNIYAADDKKSKLDVTMELFFNKDNIDLVEWKDNKKITINGYVQAYISDKKKNMYVPQTVILDCSKLDMDNEKHLKRLDFKLDFLGCERDGNKIKCKLKSSTMYKMGIVCKYINSAQEVEVDESMLTDKQREAIELGFKQLSDFADKKVYGERITQYNIYDFQYDRAEYSEGIVDIEIKPNEFEDDIYVVEKEETEDDLDNAMNKPEDDEEEDDELF